MGTSTVFEAEAAFHRQPKQTRDGNAIEIKNVGAVVALTIPVPENGGLVVLAGPNGSGKSTTLNAVHQLATGEKVGSLTPNDRSPGTGTVEGLGVKLTIGAATRRAGSSEVTSIEGRFALSDLINPGIADPVAADKRSIKAVLSLTGAKATVETFASLGDVARDIVVNSMRSAGSGDDPLTAAKAIKAALEEKARAVESEADVFKGLVLADEQSIGQADEAADAANDTAAASAAFERAVRYESELAEKRRAFEAAAIQRTADKATLKELEASLPDVAALQVERDGLQQFLAASNADIATIEAQLAERRRIDAGVRTKLDAISGELARAEQTASKFSEIRERLHGAQLPEVTTIAMAEAADAKAAAAAGVVAAEQARQRQAKRRERLGHLEQLNAAQLRAGGLRNAAQSVEPCLATLLDTEHTGLAVVDGRLVIETQRGQTYLGELSAGERCRVAVDLAIRVMRQRFAADGRHPWIVLDQERFEGLQPSVQAAMREQLEGSGVVVITAKAADEPLSVTGGGS